MVDALTRRYLRRLFFGISRDPEGKELLEEVGGAPQANWVFWLGARLLLP